MLSIVMYHYVRPIIGSNFPNIKGLEIDGFKKQLDFFQSQHSIVTSEDVIDAVLGNKDLPSNAIWLTFDDGYKDHIEFVLPELKKRRLKGAFFPPACPLVDKKLLDVNAIHFILASCENSTELLKILKDKCITQGLDEVEWLRLWDTIDKHSRWDSEEIVFIKRLLQRELPPTLRRKVLKELFEEVVGVSEADFCSSLYMSLNDIKDLIAEGMYVGSHTYNHNWLNSMTYEEQASEIDKSLNFLSKVGAPTKNWVMCYPYGGYNDATLEILRKRNCTVGLTTKVGSADFNIQSPLELSRYDTNDFHT